nr:endosomal/lysomomal potassium channel TMEM175 isoform X4 [Aotus nancymaae]
MAQCPGEGVGAGEVGPEGARGDRPRGGGGWTLPGASWGPPEGLALSWAEDRPPTRCCLDCHSGTLVSLGSDSSALVLQQFDRSVQRLLATRIAVYLMTFLIVTVAWAAHTRLFQVVGKIDDTLALLNLACMMTITFLPYTFSLMVTFPDVPLGIFAFCVCVIAIGVVQALIVGYAFHFPHLLSPQIQRSAHRTLYRRHILGIVLRGPALCFAAAIFSLFFVPLSYLLMASVILLPYVSKAASWCRDRLVGHREPSAHPVEVFTFDLHEPLSKERVEAFSDGVYAIVATLLILDIWTEPVWGCLRTTVLHVPLLKRCCCQLPGWCHQKAAALTRVVPTASWGCRVRPGSWPPKMPCASENHGDKPSTYLRSRCYVGGSEGWELGGKRPRCPTAGWPCTADALSQRAPSSTQASRVGLPLARRRRVPVTVEFQMNST